MSDEDRVILKNRIIWGMQDGLSLLLSEMTVSHPRGNWLICRARDLRGIAGDIEQFATRYAGADTAHVVDQIIDLEAQVETLRRENAEWKRRHIAQEEQSVIDGVNLQWCQKEIETLRQILREVKRDELYSGRANGPAWKERIEAALASGR